MKLRNSVLGLSACVALVACATPARVPAVEYKCANNITLLVTYAGDSATVLTSSGYSVKLPQKPAASGMYYADARHELRGKGNEVTFTLGNGAPLICRTAEA